MVMSCEFCVFLRYSSCVRWTPEEIRHQRNARGWTQPELAEALHVSARTITAWEAGESKPRNLADLDRIFGDPAERTLRGASDAELLAEVALRLAERGTESEPKPRRSPPHANQAPDTAYYRPRTGASESA